MLVEPVNAPPMNAAALAPGGSVAEYPRCADDIDRAEPEVEEAEVALDVIDLGDNIRDDDDNLEDLAASLRDQGLIQAPRVRPGPLPGRYILECGFRRFKAARRAGWTTLRVCIDRRPRQPLDVLLTQLAENLHRQDLRPVQLARVLARLRDEHRLSVEQSAQAIKKPACFVSRKLSLLKHAPAVQQAVDDGDLAEASAVEIAKLRDDAEREKLAQRVIRNQIPHAKVAALVAAHTRGRKAGAAAARPVRSVRLQLGPQGATVAVGCPDAVAALTVEEVQFALEFALKEIRKALRKNLPVAELPGHFRQLAVVPRGTSDPTAGPDAVVGVAGSPEPLP